VFYHTWAAGLFCLALLHLSEPLHAGAAFARYCRDDSEDPHCRSSGAVAVLLAPAFRHSCGLGRTLKSVEGLGVREQPLRQRL
jgi:hypothetical protein